MTIFHCSSGCAAMNEQTDTMRRPRLDGLAYAAEVAQAASPRLAGLATLRHCFDRFDRPVAVWAREGDGGDLHLVGALGLTSSQAELIRTDMPASQPWNSVSDRGRSDILRRFAALAGEYPVEAVEADDLLVLVAGVDVDISEHLFELRSFLKEIRPRAWEWRSSSALEPLEMALASAAHEIRGPLLAAKAAVERSLVDPDPHTARSLLERSAAQLGQLAGDVLGLLRWSSGADGLILEATPIAEAIRQACRLGTAEAGSERLTIICDDSVAMLDRKHFPTAIANLITNALAYSADGSGVAVTARSAEATVAVTVSDSGPGIPPAEHERVFAPFVRGRSAAAKPGAGLGLFIVRRIVDAHGGRILIESGFPGTKITVHVPKGADAR